MAPVATTTDGSPRFATQEHKHGAGEVQMKGVRSQEPGVYLFSSLCGKAARSHEGRKSKKGWPNSILISNDLSHHRIDYDNGND